MLVRMPAQSANGSMEAHLKLISMGILILHSRKYILFSLGWSVSNRYRYFLRTSFFFLFTLNLLMVAGDMILSNK